MVQSTCQNIQNIHKTHDFKTIKNTKYNFAFVHITKECHFDIQVNL